MNPLLHTDVYKINHMRQYHPDTVEVYSYLEARKPGNKIPWYGLQYYLKEYLTLPITMEDADGFCISHERVLGPVPTDVENKIYALGQLGYWPVEIKAPPEGLIIDSQNALMTIRNTKPEFYWCVGFLESLLLKVWYPCTVAAASKKYYDLVKKYSNLTCDNGDHLPFAVHDFGYRGVSSEESAAIAGSSHLLYFKGSDTLTATELIEQYYHEENSALSVPASEHSVMCSYGREGEWDAFDRMLDLYPEGIVSIVSDSYDYWKVLTEWAVSRKDRIMSRKGKVVFRPDSGNPKEIICGRPFESLNPHDLGSLELLWQTFGGAVNKKGYRVLDPHVGLIYGDGMYYERFQDILETMGLNGFASSNLVIGVGGILLQNHSRDEYGFALKASRVIRGEEEVEIFKDPITDPGKRSKKGLMCLTKTYSGVASVYSTIDQCSGEVEKQGLLQPVFRDGKILVDWTYEQVKNNGISI